MLFVPQEWDDGSQGLSWMDGGFQLQKELHLVDLDTYDTWSHALSVYLRASGHTGWALTEEDDFRLASTILATIGLEPSRLLLGVDSGMAMLDHLERHYRSMARGESHAAYDDLQELKYHGDRLKYCSRHKELLEEVKDAATPVPEDEAIAIFIRGTQGLLPEWAATQSHLQGLPHAPDHTNFLEGFLRDGTRIKK